MQITRPETIVHHNTELDAAIRAARQHTLGDVLRRTAQRLPDKPAVVFDAVSWTYSELDAICNRVANALLARGVQLGDRVAILSRNSSSFVALRFALARIGAVLVPINFMLNASEIAFILRSCGATMLTTGSEFFELGRSAAALDTAVASLVWLPQEGSGAPPAGVPVFVDLLNAADTPPQVAVDARALAQIVYTSGTESLPKGAMLTHDAVLWEYVSCVIEQEMAPQDVMLHALPLYHCAQLDVFLGPAIYVGITNVICGQPKPEVILPMLAAHRISSFFAPPSVWIALMRSPLWGATDLSALRKGYYGASIMPVEVLRELAGRLPDMCLWNLYGQTEIAPLATVLKPQDQLRKAGSAGRAAINVETRGVDDALRDVAVGEVGEIVHRSPQLLTGYFNDPDKTAAAFEGGWFHSGDLGLVDAEGYITVVDRKKDMIKSGGENVASREVEEAIYQLPQVSEVAVVGLPDPFWIEAVSAVVVCKAGQVVTAAEIIAHCRARLAGFKAPKRVFFTDALPKNPSGKVLKRDLRVKYSSA